MKHSQHSEHNETQSAQWTQWNTVRAVNTVKCSQSSGHNEMQSVQWTQKNAANTCPHQRLLHARKKALKFLCQQASTRYRRWVHSLDFLALFQSLTFGHSVYFIRLVHYRVATTEADKSVVWYVCYDLFYVPWGSPKRSVRMWTGYIVNHMCSSEGILCRWNP